MPVTYNPQIFSVKNIGEAQAIILTAETSTTEARWSQETPHLCKLIEAHAKIGTETIVLDYGCGIGRLAKALIDRYGCRVVGVDISAEMRSLSLQYVNSDRFLVCSPEMFGVLLEGGLRFDFSISVWVLQHCLKPAEDIGAIRKGLKTGGVLFIVNNITRAVPSREAGWVDDGIDIKATLDKAFAFKAGDTLRSPDVPSSLSGTTFWAMFEKP